MTGEVSVVAVVSTYAVMVPVLEAPGPVRVNVAVTRRVPAAPAPFRMVTVAVWAVLSFAVSVKVIWSNQWPAVRALLTLLLLPDVGNVAAAEATAVLATTPKPLSVTVIVPVLVWYVPISPVLVVDVTARLAARTPATIPNIATTTRARMGTFLLVA